MSSSESSSTAPATVPPVECRVGDAIRVRHDQFVSTHVREDGENLWILDETRANSKCAYLRLVKTSGSYSGTTYAARLDGEETDLEGVLDRFANQDEMTIEYITLKTPQAGDKEKSRPRVRFVLGKLLVLILDSDLDILEGAIREKTGLDEVDVVKDKYSRAKQTIEFREELADLAAQVKRLKNMAVSTDVDEVKLVKDVKKFVRIGRTVEAHIQGTLICLKGVVFAPPNEQTHVFTLPKQYWPCDTMELGPEIEIEVNGKVHVTPKTYDGRVCFDGYCYPAAY